MTLLDWLRKLGIFRFGVETAVFYDATERPMSFQQDGIFNSEKDAVHFGKKDDRCPKPEGEEARGT